MYSYIFFKIKIMSKIGLQQPRITRSTVHTIEILIYELERKKEEVKT